MLACSCGVDVVGCCGGAAVTVSAAGSEGGLRDVASGVMFELRVSCTLADSSASLRALANDFEAGLTCTCASSVFGGALAPSTDPVSAATFSSSPSTGLVFVAVCGLG